MIAGLVRLIISALRVIGFLFATVVILLVLASRAGAATGPDVSNYQHPNGVAINWPQVRSAGHTFAFVKATEGPSGAGGYYTNPYFHSDWAGAGAAGLYRGAYHFAQPQLPLDSAVLQARYFVSVTGSMHGIVDLPPVLDLESTGGLSKSELVVWTQTWLTETERLTGRRPIIYAGYYFWNDNVGSTNFSGYRLWIPRYTSAADPYPLPNSWSTWTLWQYTSSAQVPGIIGNVDMNAFCCPATSLAALADGSTTNAAAGNPFGALDATSRSPNSIAISGWSIDPDTPVAINVHVYVDGLRAATVTANAPRGDISALFPGWGPEHGYEATVPVSPGSHDVCVYAINKATGTTNTTLGCRSVKSNPSGSLDVASSPGPGQLSVGGWAIDPDTTGAIDVHLYVDGKAAAVVAADTPRADVATTYPAFGAAHGFAKLITSLASGDHTVCAYAINAGSGDSNITIGCRNLAVLTSDPIGMLDQVSAGPGTVYLRGWALDPDTSAAISVHVYVDGHGIALTASGGSAMAAGAYPSDFGPNHGFSTTIGGLAVGAHGVCAYGINVSLGANSLLACRSFTVSTGSPIGHLDEISTRGLSMIAVRGWAIDPDTGSPANVHVYVDQKKVGEVLAADDRGDIGFVYPAFGSTHGYQLEVPGFAGGFHSVCTYGINVGSGTNALLGCSTITTSGDPFGSIDTATSLGGGTSVTIFGWTIDPDVTTPIMVHVYVDGVGRAVTTADQLRGDLALNFSKYGPNHGYATTISNLSAGAHDVCAFAIDVGGIKNTQLGCRTI